MDKSLTLALRICAGRLLSIHVDTTFTPLNPYALVDLTCRISKEYHSSKQVTRLSLSAALNPIARPSKLSFNLLKGPYISSFDGSTSIIIEDLAPYVRSIVSYDLRLEEQRLRLAMLLSQGARNGKRVRTTRASRAALEGGNKQHTRRERWFPANVDFSMILESGGKEWQDVLWQSIGQQLGVAPREGNSRSSSVGSLTSSSS